MPLLSLLLQGEEIVTSAVASNFKGASLKLLDDQQVRGAAQEMVKQLLEQPQMQAKTSEHLWAAVRGIVLPNRRGQTAETAAVAQVCFPM